MPPVGISLDVDKFSQRQQSFAFSVLWNTGLRLFSLSPLPTLSETTQKAGAKAADFVFTLFNFFTRMVMKGDAIQLHGKGNRPIACLTSPTPLSLTRKKRYVWNKVREAGETYSVLRANSLPSTAHARASVYVRRVAVYTWDASEHLINT